MCFRRQNLRRGQVFLVNNKVRTHPPNMASWWPRGEFWFHLTTTLTSSPAPPLNHSDAQQQPFTGPLHELSRAPDWGKLVCFCFFHLRIIAQALVTFSTRCLAMVLHPVPGLCRSTVLSLPSLETLDSDCTCGQVCFTQVTSPKYAWEPETLLTDGGSNTYSIHENDHLQFFHMLFE